MQYGYLLKSDKTAFQELFTGVLDGAPPKPQRGRMAHFYSRKFYDTRIKEEVEERLASLTRHAEREGGPPPKRIDVIAKVTAECWDRETPEFQRDCELALEREYQQVLKGWEASLSDSPTRTAEEIAALVIYFLCILVADAVDIGHSLTRHSTCSHSSTPSRTGLGCA
jgi:hypothetical protein